MYEVQPSTAHLDLMVAKLPGCLRRTPRQSSCPPSSSPWSPLPSSTWSIGYAEGKKLPIKQSTDHLFNVHNVEHSRTLGDAKRISIFKSSAIVTCEGRLLQRVLLGYFFLSIFSLLNICTVNIFFFGYLHSKRLMHECIFSIELNWGQSLGQSKYGGLKK